MINPGLRGRCVLVTGANNPLGIGAATAVAFARLEARVFLHYHRTFDGLLSARYREQQAKSCDEVLDALHAVGATADVCEADFTDPDAAAIVFERAERAMGRVDVLVNNAGFATFGPFAASDLAVEIDEIRLNVETLTDLTKRMLPDVLAAKGRILNVASTAAFQPGPVMAVYYATKAYVLSFSEALAFELKPSGVGVTCLCPGPTRTGFQARAHQEGARLLDVGLMDAAVVARAGVNGLFRGRAVVVPGFMNRVGVWVVRFSPRRAVLWVINWLHQTHR